MDSVKRLGKKLTTRKQTGGPGLKWKKGSGSNNPKLNPDVEMQEAPPPEPAPAANPAPSRSSNASAGPHITEKDVPEQFLQENTRIDFNIHWKHPDHKKRFDQLKGRKLIPSRFVDSQIANQIGVYNEVKQLCENIGIWNFVSNVVPTYRTLNWEFLSTWSTNNNQSKCEFFLDGQKHTLTIRQLNTILGFPNEQNMLYELKSLEQLSQKEFYKRLFGNVQVSPRASQIQHPTIRYIQWVLAYTIFGRGETTGKLRKAEMFFIFCMLKHNAPLFGRWLPNVGYFLIRHMDDITLNPADKGDISIGGIVTRIAQHFKLLGTPPQRVVVEGPTTTDMACLLQYKFIRKEGDHYVNITYDGNVTRLPIDVPLDRTDDNTWVIRPIITDDPTDLPQYAPNMSEWWQSRGDQGQSSRTAANDPTNAMLHEQLIQLNENFAELSENYGRLSSDYNRLSTEYTRLSADVAELQDFSYTMYDWIDRVDNQVHDVHHMTQLMNNWHISQGHYVMEPPPPRQVPERPRRRQPHQGQPSSSHRPPD